MKKIVMLLILFLFLNHAFAYTVSGYVKKADGTPVLNARIYVYGQSNSQHETYTNSSGYYSITIDPGWGGFLYCSKVGFTFTPADYAYSNVSQNYSGKNYTAVPVPVKVFGHVETYFHDAIQGVTMSGFPTSVVTGQDGNFQTYVDYGWSGTVTPQKTGYSFNPQSVDLNNVIAEINTGWFTGTLLQYTVSGNVKDASGTGIQGVAMNGLPGNPVTDVAGNYSVSVSHGWSGTVTPQKAGYTFSPASLSVSAVVGNIVLGDVTGNRTDFVISGHIKRANNFGVEGVTLSGLPGNPVTNSDGYYEASVPTGWSGIAKPSFPHGVFLPDSIIYSLVDNDKITNYIASIESFTIGGLVLNQNGQPVAGVKISGFPFGDVFTNADGAYSGIVEYGWSGTFSPEKTGFSFEPNSFQLSNVVANQQVNYTATALTYTLSGRVYDAVHDFGFDGVEMRGLPGVYTGYDGYYSLSGIQPGTTFTYEPIVVGVKTNPEPVTVTVNSDMTVNFTGSAYNVTISGQVKKPDGTGYPYINFIIPGSGVAFTDVNGNYSIMAPYHYTGRFGPYGGSKKYSQRYYEINDLRQDMTCNFQVITPPAGISGAVFFNQTYEPLEGVTITDLNTSQLMATTDADGAFAIAATQGTNYMLKFEKNGYAFSNQILNITYYNPSYNEILVSEIPFTIAGLISEKGNPVEGVDMLISGEIRSTTSDQGYYNISVPHHWSGTVIASKPGYAFEPDTIVFNDVNDHQMVNISANFIGKQISGYVVTPQGDSLHNAVISAGGFTTTTNTSGFFNLLIPDNWSGYVTASMFGYRFSPDSVFIPSPDNDTLIHFTASPVFITISGFIRLFGDAMSQVQIVGLPHQILSDTAGFYSDSVPYGWSGTIKPAKTGYHFSPDSVTMNGITNHRTIDFNGFINLYQVSGMVSCNGNPLTGILLIDESDSVFTDSLGLYSFTVPHGWSGSVVPVSQVYHFNPDTAFYSGVFTNLSANFTATINTYAVSGHVNTAQGDPLQNVTISASDTMVYSDLAGNYSFLKNYGWSGVLKPVKTGYSFTPDSAILSGLSANQTVDFTAIKLKFSVSGTVSDTAGNALSGIEITGFPVAVVSGENGYFSCEVEYGWSGIVAAQNEYYYFDPLIIGPVVQNITGFNFMGVPVSHEFWGRISYADNIGVGGVVITGLPTEGLTVSDGNFNVLVPHRFSGIAVPVKAGLEFTPDTVVIDQIISDMHVDFTASVQMLRIRGRILCNGLPLPGVAMVGSIDTAYTNESGNYEVLVPYQWSGWLTPQKEGFIFTPASLYFSNVTQNSNNNNFSAVAPVICGYVRLSDGTPVAGVSLTGLPGNATTDSAGFYISLAGANFTGTVVPKKAGYIFSPDTVFYNGLTQNDTTHYTATEIFYTISGYITGSDSLPVANAAIYGLPIAVMSDTTGFYSAVVRQGWSGVLIPVKQGYYFVPDTIQIDSICADTSIIINGFAIYFQVSGAVSFNGYPLSNVAVTGLPQATLTSNDGFYSAIVPYAWSGIVVPVKAGLEFTPDTVVIEQITSDMEVNFEASVQMFRVLGRILCNGLPLPGVAMIGSIDTAYTNESGNYEVLVPYQWSGWLTPQKEGFIFTPASLYFSNVTQNSNNNNFSAVAPVICGYVRLSDGTPVAGVSLTGLPGNATTDSAGFYISLAGANFTGTVVPKKAGYIFSPDTVFYNGLTQNDTTHYTATEIFYTISGYITGSDSLPVANAAIYGLPVAVMSDTTGFYSAVVRYGWSGILMPEKDGLAFTPAVVEIDSITADTIIDFTSRIQYFTVSGWCTLNGSPMQGVEILGLPSVINTDSLGYFSDSVPYNWSGMIYPAKTGYTFTPDTIYLNEVKADTSIWFACNPILFEVSGYVITAGSAPVVSAMLTGFSDTVFTNTEGYFSSIVGYNWSGVIVISKPGYTFNPDTIVLSNVLCDTVLNINAGEIRFMISGTVTLVTGQPAEGVLMQAYIASATTDSAGYYQLSVPWNYTGIVLPQKTGLLFEPYVRYYNQTLSDVSGQDYVAFAAPVISGTITNENGEPLADVDLIGFPQIVYTNPQGFFSVTVPSGWSGVVTPVKQAYTFMPDTIVFDSIYSDTSISINGLAVQYQVTGVVTLSGSPLCNVLITGLPQATLTNAEGLFTAMVPYGWSGIVVPVMNHIAFTPDTVFIGPVSDNPDTLFFTARILQIPYVTWMSPDETVIDNCDDVNLQWSTDYPAAYYHLIVATSFDFSNVVVDTSYLTNSYFHLNNLTDGMDYWWKVAATGADGTGDCRTAHFITQLKAPSALTVQPDVYNPSVASLQWIDNSENELGYLVEMKHGDSLSNNTFEVLDTMPAGSTTFEIFIGADMGMFTFRVKAYNDLGESDYSNMAVFDTGNGIDSENEMDVSVQVYPNPASDYVSFNFYTLASEQYSIEVFNLSGSKIFTVSRVSTSGKDNLTRIPVINWPNEEFIYLISIGNKKARGKFMTR